MSESIERQQPDVREISRDADSSVALFRVAGVGQAVCNEECRIEYTNLCGDGIFVVNGEVKQFYEGAQLTVEPGDEYVDIGTFLARAVSIPSFREDQVRPAQIDVTAEHLAFLDPTSQTTQLVV